MIDEMNDHSYVSVIECLSNFLSYGGELVNILCKEEIDFDGVGLGASREVYDIVTEAEDQV